MQTSKYAGDETLCNIRNAIDQQADLNKKWSEYAAFVYSKSLSQQDMQMLKNHNRDTFDFNIVRPFIWKSLKNVRDSSITATFLPKKSAEQVNQQELSIDKIADIVNQKYQSIQEKCGYDDIIYRASTDAYVGGKGVIKVKTDYENSYNFDQEFIIEYCLNPTRVYFDNKAKEPTKSDSRYVFEIISLSEDEFKQDYPLVDFRSIENAEYSSTFSTVVGDGETNKKIVNIVEYYYKETKEIALYELKNGNLTKDAPKDKKQIARQRMIHDHTVMMKRVIADIELTAPVETNFKSLPYIMVMGERYYDKDNKEHICPFAKHAFDAQRVKNLMMNYFLYEATNERTSIPILPEECITNETEEALVNPTIKKILRYKSVHITPDGQTVLVKPDFVPAGQLPTQYLEVFQALDQTVESTVGATMPSLDNAQMSGKALYNLTQFISAGNEQYMQNLGLAAVQIAKVILEAMPKVLEKEVFDIVDKELGETQQEFDFMFETELLNIDISRGVDNKLQKEATIETLMDFAEKSPMFAQFMNTPKAISLIISNLDLNDKDKLESAWDDFLEQQQQSQQQNPQMQETEIDNTKAQAMLISAKAKAADVNLRAQELGMQQRNKENDQLIEQHKIKSANHRNTENNQVKVLQSKDSLNKHLIDHLAKQSGM